MKDKEKKISTLQKKVDALKAKLKDNADFVEHQRLSKVISEIKAPHSLAKKKAFDVTGKCVGSTKINGEWFTYQIVEKAYAECRSTPKSS